MIRVRRDNWPEIVATLLLAFAAVATAWSSYQAARWNGEQAKTSGSVNKTRLEATRASALANAQTQVDVATFTQWVDAALRTEACAAGVASSRITHGSLPL